MNKHTFFLVTLFAISFVGPLSAASLSISGPSHPYMYDVFGNNYTGIAPASGAVSSTVLAKSGKLRLPNGKWINLSVTASGRGVSTNVIFHNTNKHTLSLYLKLQEKIVSINEKGKPEYLLVAKEYSGAKAVDPCVPNIECVK